MALHNELGNEGEKLAIAFLQEKNYEVLECNYRYLKAEIDIIARYDTTLVVIEVKTRTTNYFGNPQEFVNPKKIKQLVKAADHYIIDNDLDVEVRFDIIAITKSKTSTQIEHIEDAFFHF